MVLLDAGNQYLQATKFLLEYFRVQNGRWHLLQHHTEPPAFATDQMSPTKDTVKVAAVQAAPVAFDLPKSLTKVAHFTAEAAKAGADLVVFP